MCKAIFPPDPRDQVIIELCRGPLKECAIYRAISLHPDLQRQQLFGANSRNITDGFPGCSTNGQFTIFYHDTMYNDKKKKKKQGHKKK